MYFVWTRKKKDLTESSNYFLSTKQLGDQGQLHIKQCQFSRQYRKVSAIYFCKKKKNKFKTWFVDKYEMISTESIKISLRWFFYGFNLNFFRLFYEYWMKFKKKKVIWLEFAGMSISVEIDLQWNVIRGQE